MTPAEKLEALLEPIRAEHPSVEIIANPTAEATLRHATRNYAPEVADALDSGDVVLAGELLLARLESSPADASR